MQATFEIQEIPTGLSLRVHEPRNLGLILLILPVGSVATYLFLRAAPNSGILQVSIAGVCIFFLIRGILSSWLGTAVELRVTNLDFISTGRCPEEGYKPSVTARADVYDLVYHQASGGGDDPEIPKGLYIQHHAGGILNPDICVLPHLDEAQTGQAIEAIYRRFPDTGKLVPATPFEPYLTSLNLSQTNRE
jgi:hypothetical protein